MFEEYINRILENERAVVLSRQEKTVPDVIEEKTVIEKEDYIPDKFRNDIEALKNRFGESFKSGLCINLSLQRILMIIPRKRKDAYRGLVSYLKTQLGIELNITSQKKKEEEK